MRILNLVAGEKWTGPAAVVFDQTAALVAAGVEAQFAMVSESLLADRLLPLGWVRPLITHPRTPMNVLRDSRRLHQAILREKFDIVHSHTTHDHAIALFAVRRTPALLVRTLHHVRYGRGDPRTRLLFEKTDAFAFANRTIGEEFGRPGAVLPPAVDVDRFRPVGGGTEVEETRRRFGIPAGIVAGTVGKMAARRGHDEAIRAAAPLSGVALAHVGHGERMPDFKRLAEQLGAAGRNTFLGYQEEALADLYRSWDLFLFTASGSDQGQRAILEAMASGLPVVARDVPGVRDLLNDGEQGLIVATAEETTRALARLAESPELRRKMGAASRQRSLSFTADRFAEKAKAFYASLKSPIPGRRA